MESVSASTQDNACGTDDDDEDLVDIPTSQRKQNGPIAKLRKSIIKIRSSPQRREAFRRQCDVAGIQSLELLRDVETRWNSTLDMISRALLLRAPLDCALKTDAKLTGYLLNENEWNILKSVKVLLEPFKDITTFMSAEKYPTISFCSVVYSTLYEHLETYMTDPKRGLKGIDPTTGVKYPNWIQLAATEAHDKLSKYYPTSDANVYVLGTVLDPRYKLEYYSKIAKLRPEVLTGYKKNLTELWKKNYKPSNNDSAQGGSAAEQNVEKKETLFEKHLKGLNKNEPKDKDELEKYLSQKTVSSSSVPNGILSWWKNHEEEYPNLAKMARDALAAAGAGVSVECLFSNGPDLLGPRRQSMGPERITQCFCLKYWLEYKDTTDLNALISAVNAKFDGFVS